jgi:hypothetical protein
MEAKPLCGVVTAAILAMVGAAGAQTCGWTWVNPAPPRHDIYRLKYENGRFVAVGAAGTVMRSQDGEDWEVVESGVHGDLYGIDWGAGFYVAVGDGVVLRSADGGGWTEAFRDDDATFLDVEFSVSRFVAVGAGRGGKVATSVRGDEWELVPVPWGGTAGSVVGTNDGFFVSVGTEIWFSSDGFEWEYETSVPALLSEPRQSGSVKTLDTGLFDLDRVDLAWTGERLLWANGSDLWVWEPDDEWELVLELDGCPGLRDWLGVIAGPGWAMASGISGCPSPYQDPIVSLAFSSNGGSTFGNTWEDELGGFPALARYGHRWFALGALGDVLTSEDGATWRCSHGGCTATVCADGFADVVSSGDLLVAVGGAGLCDGGLKRHAGATTAVSVDGTHWTVSPHEDPPLRGVAWTGSQYVAVGDGWIARSPDGVTWTGELSPDGAFLHSVAVGGGWVVSVGTLGAIYASADGIDWQKPFLYFSEDLDRVVWDGAQFLALGHAGSVLRSADAVNWSFALTSVEADLKGAAASPERRVAVGTDGVILASTDGEVWSQRLSGVTTRLDDVAYGDDRFVAVGWQEQPDGTRPSVVLASADGDRWTRFPAPGEAPHRVVWTGDRWLAVGGDRTILETECLGTLIEVDNQHVHLPHGGSADLTVRLSEPAVSDLTVAVESALPEHVVVEPTATVSEGSDTFVVRATGAGVAAGVVLTYTLPDSVGGGVATSLVTVQPPQWTPRRPSGRVGP